MAHRLKFKLLFQHHISECVQSCHPIKVICDAYTPAGVPIPTNKRHRAAEIFSNKKVVDEIPWLVLQLSQVSFVVLNEK